jgi:hypothetical protein
VYDEEGKGGKGEMTGTQITLMELCTSCIHDNNDCEEKDLYIELGYTDGSYYCSNHEEKEDADG